VGREEAQARAGGERWPLYDGPSGLERRASMIRWTALTVIGMAALGYVDRGNAGSIEERIIALSRGALDRWGRGDPKGYLELYAPDVRYIDPIQDGWVDGIDRMRGLLTPLTGKVQIDRYDMIEPAVRVHGDLAVLSYRLVNYRKRADGTEAPASRWNNTEVYRQIEGEWKIVHSHWSFTRPELRQAPPD
jgi:ketosteroid isomerase-like protein